VTKEQLMPTLRKELLRIGEPVLRTVLDHPFWSGIGDGSLPGGALAYFVHQDTRFLLPGYARALARCAAVSAHDDDALLLGRSVAGSFEAAAGLRRRYGELAPQLGLPALDERHGMSAPVRAHTAFFAAATAASYHAGIGALLPMVWFNGEVSDHLRSAAVPRSRYAPWTEAYHPGDDYQYVVQAFFGLVDRIDDESSAQLCQSVTEQFSFGVRYELAFAECCLTQAAEMPGIANGFRSRFERKAV
jgi:thiaminase (transcriptional activator TenA)